MKMEPRKFHEAKQERLITVNHITQKRNLDSPKQCLTTKGNLTSINCSKKYLQLDYDVTSDSLKCYFCEHQNSLVAVKAEQSKEDIFLDKGPNTEAVGRMCSLSCSLRPSTLLKKRLWYRCLPVNFAKFLRTPFLIVHLRWLLLLIIGKKPSKNLISTKKSLPSSITIQE